MFDFLVGYGGLIGLCSLVLTVLSDIVLWVRSRRNKKNNSGNSDDFLMLKNQLSEFISLLKNENDKGDNNNG